MLPPNDTQTYQPPKAEPDDSTASAPDVLGLSRWSQYALGITGAWQAMIANSMAATAAVFDASLDAQKRAYDAISTTALAQMNAANEICASYIAPKRTITNFDTRPIPEALQRLAIPGMKTGFFRTEGGRIALRYAHIKPPRQTASIAAGPKDTYWFWPGKNAFIELYLPQIQPIVEQGHHAYIFDPRSQGLSARTTENLQMVHVRSYDEYIADAITFYEKIIRPRQQGRLILDGTSLGGHLAMRALMSGAFDAYRAVLVAPMVQAKGLPHPNTKQGKRVRQAATFNALVKGDTYFPFNRCASNHDRHKEVETCLNPETQQAYLAANEFTNYHPGIIQLAKLLRAVPDVISGGVSADWVRSKYESMLALEALPPHIIAEQLRVIWSGYDQVVCNKAAEDFFSQKALLFSERVKSREIYFTTAWDMHAFAEAGSPEDQAGVVCAATSSVEDLPQTIFPFRPNKPFTWERPAAEPAFR